MLSIVMLNVFILNVVRLFVVSPLTTVANLISKFNYFFCKLDRFIFVRYICLCTEMG